MAVKTKEGIEIDNYIKKHYAEDGAAVIAKKFGKSASGIRRKACMLGIKRNKSPKAKASNVVALLAERDAQIEKLEARNNQLRTALIKQTHMIVQIKKAIKEVE